MRYTDPAAEGGLIGVEPAIRVERGRQTFYERPYTGERMRICFCSDFHGKATLYEQLAEFVRAEQPAVLILGGDMLPDGDIDDPIVPQVAFVHDELMPRVEALREAVPGLAVACILGNHDWACSRQALQDFHDDGRIVLLEHRQAWIHNGLSFLGYSKTPPTPHWAKDYERLDREGEPMPETGGLAWSPEAQCLRSVRAEEHFPKYATIEAELACAAIPAGPWIFVCHAPPFDTKLDRLPHVEYPIGSKAVGDFIRARRPVVALHGHVHESPEFTGSHADRVGDTLCINPGQSRERLHAVVFDSADAAGTLRHTVRTGAPV